MRGGDDRSSPASASPTLNYSAASARARRIPMRAPAANPTPRSSPSRRNSIATRHETERQARRCPRRWSAGGVFSVLLPPHPVEELVCQQHRGHAGAESADDIPDECPPLDLRKQLDGNNGGHDPRREMQDVGTNACDSGPVRPCRRPHDREEDRDERIARHDGENGRYGDDQDCENARDVTLQRPDWRAPRTDHTARPTSAVQRGSAPSRSPSRRE